MAKTPFEISVIKRGIRFISKSLGNEGALHSLRHCQRKERQQNAESEISIALIQLGGKGADGKREFLNRLKEDVSEGHVEPEDAIELVKISENAYPHFLDWSRTRLRYCTTKDQKNVVLDLTRNNGEANAQSR